MRYFSFQEFERSAIANKYGIDNTMPDKIKPNVAALVDNVLDPLREVWGGPIDISSGYRCPILNANPEIKGSKTSQHMTGEAADLQIFVRDAKGKLVKDQNGHAIVDRAANRLLFQKIIGLDLPFDQLIDEHNFAWVHVSHRANGRQRKEVKKL